MKICVLNGNDSGFDKRSSRILELYNEASSSPFDEVFEPVKRDSLSLIYVEGMPGGVIVDKWHRPDGTFLFHSIMFAGFEEQDRRKGCLKACIENAGFEIETVQINGGDPVDVWKRLGFKKVGIYGMVAMLRAKEIEGVDWSVCEL